MGSAHDLHMQLVFPPSLGSKLLQSCDDCTEHASSAYTPYFHIFGQSLK